MSTPTSAVKVNPVTGALIDPPVATFAAANGLLTGGSSDAKGSVRVATTANGTLATAYENGDTVDGVVLATADRILLKNQTAPAENGIYTVNASGAPTRATDFDAWTEIVGAFTNVEAGTVNAGTQWLCNVVSGGTMGVTDITFVVPKNFVDLTTNQSVAGLKTFANITITALTGNVAQTASVTTGTGTSAGYSIVANSLTTGEAFSLTTSSNSSGRVVNIASTSNAVDTNVTKLVQLGFSGANTSGGLQTFSAYISNTRTGSGINHGLYSTAGAGSTNRAIMANISAAGAASSNAAVYAYVSTIGATDNTCFKAEVTALSTATNNYGLYADIQGGTTNYAIYVANGISALLATTVTTLNGITLSGSGSLANSGTSSLTGFTGSGTSSGTNTGDQTSVTGNAGTATALATARNIFNISFNGTANVAGDATNTGHFASIPGTGAAGHFITENGTAPTLIAGRSAWYSDGSGVPSYKNGTGTAVTLVRSSDIGVSVQSYDADLTTWAGITPGANVGTALGVAVGSVGAFVVNGGALGTPSSGTLTSCTGLPITGITSSTSAQLRTLLSDENGTGAALFSGATSPDFTTSITTGSASFTAFAGATTLLTIGGTGASASLFAPSTLDATSTTTGAIRTSGGLGVAKNIYLGSNLNIPSTASSSVGSIRQNGVNLIHTYGTNNQFIGEGAGNFTLSGSSNQCIGRNTGLALTTGSNNVFIGQTAGTLVTTGSTNVAVGANAMGGSGTGATDNMAIGNEALRYTTDNQSVAMGVYALNNSSSGTNTAVGWAALNTITTGTNNVAIGNSGGRSLTSAAGQNTFIGSQAGYHASQLVSATNSMALGYNTYTTASNQCVLGNSSITSTILRGSVTSGTNGIAYTNIRHGVSGAMTAGVVTVTDTGCTANTRYMFATHTIGTITLPATYYASTRTASTSFVITSSMITDTSTVDWIAIEP